MVVSSQGKALSDLSRWAEKAGIKLNGIAPRILPGKGTGVVATRDIKAGSVVLEAPTSAIRCLDNISLDERTQLRWKQGHGTPGSPRISLHGILAAHPLISGRVPSDGSEVSGQHTKSDHDIWAACAPSFQTFRDGFPIMWTKHLQGYLPYGVKYLLDRQRAKFENDWSIVKDIPAIHSLSRQQEDSPETTPDPKEQYLYSWLLISSRTFYNDTESASHYPPDERLALIPMADFFNHNSSTPDVAAAFDTHSYTYTATHPIPAGQEINISYGDHSNDFLLAEYGFFLSNPAYDPDDPDKSNTIFRQTNPHDSICLDDAIFLSKRSVGDYRDELIRAHRENPNIDGASTGNTEDNNTKWPEYYTAEDKDIGNYALSFRAVSPTSSSSSSGNDDGDGEHKVYLSKRARFAISILLGGRDSAPDVLFASDEEWDSECTGNAQVTALLDELLIHTKGLAAARLAILTDLTICRIEPEVPRLMLIERWEQIKAMADASVNWLRNRNLS